MQQKSNNKKENIPVSTKMPAKDVDNKRTATTTSKTVNNNTKLSSGLKEQCVNNNTNLQQSGKMEQISSKR